MLSEADEKHYEDQLAAERAFQKECFNQIPCVAEDGKLVTMGKSGKCKLEDVSIHRVECKTCDKIGYYSERGRLAEERGVPVDQVSWQDADEATKKKYG